MEIEMSKAQEITKVKLNITMSYPIKWGIYAVMRDYIQNFFDAVGPEQFGEKFKYKYEDMKLTMYAPTCFDKRWLFFMGTSTKRDSNKTYAGKFGEGFKIASLVAYRDLKLKIRMESQDWRLQVTEIEDMIDGNPVKFLAYDISVREYEENAVLTLEGVNCEQHNAFLYGIKRFYYKGNPRFGNIISCGENYAIYHSNIESNKPYRRGYLYAAYQERYDYALPIIVCHHTYIPNRDDRDREKFFSYDAKRCMTEVFEKVQPSEAMEILEAISMCWRGTALKNVNFNTEPLVVTLIHRVMKDKVTKLQFVNKYKDKLVADFNKVISKDKKKIALLWYRHSEYHDKRKVVINKFAELGIMDLEQLCKQNNGFQVYSNPTRKERKYIRVLEQTATEVLGDILSYDCLPKCDIVINPEVVIDGVASTRKSRGKKKEKLGLHVESEITKVHLKRYLFKEDCFHEAFSVYAHELLHQYGGDSSLQFHKALLMMNKRIIEKSESFNKYELRWREIT